MPAAPADNCHTSFEHVQTIDTPAVFDLKWAPGRVRGQHLLGQADADGAVVLHALGDGDQRTLSTLASANIRDGGDTSRGPSSLFVAWNAPADSAEVAVSHTEGLVSVWRLGDQGLEQTAKWRAHDMYEVWTVAFDAQTPTLLYSGADDSLFRGWDLRSVGAGATRPALSSTQHKAGVCTIQPHPWRPFVLATGSYDEHLRVWDTRSMAKPLVDIETGGGVRASRAWLLIH